MECGAEVLLVDDNPADIDLVREALSKSSSALHVSAVGDGEEAIRFLRKRAGFAEVPEPDLIVLDLNLPRKDGREVLKEVKTDAVLARIPVVIFTTSAARTDVNFSYEHGANCYLQKPGNFPDYMAVVKSLAGFWLGLALLPNKEMQ